jgi:hypothetical protein
MEMSIDDNNNINFQSVFFILHWCTAHSFLSDPDPLTEMWGSEGSEYEGDCLLGCCTM